MKFKLKNKNQLLCRLVKSHTNKYCKDNNLMDMILSLYPLFSTTMLYYDLTHIEWSRLKLLKGGRKIDWRQHHIDCSYKCNELIDKFKIFDKYYCYIGADLRYTKFKDYYESKNHVYLPTLRKVGDELLI